MLARMSALAGLTATLIFAGTLSAFAQSSILNVSYDVSRELYKEINPAFAEEWKLKSGKGVEVKQSHAGSTRQAQAVAEGLEADVVTMNRRPTSNSSQTRGLWRRTGARNSPWCSALYVRVGVPGAQGQSQRDQGLGGSRQTGIQVVIPNPTLTGNGRYTYLAAWGYAKETLGEAAAKDFVGKLFANVPVFDGGGRGATTTFTQRGIGDALVTFENEARLIGAEVGADKFDVIYPSISVEAPAPIAINDKVVEKRGTRDVS